MHQQPGLVAPQGRVGGAGLVLEREPRVEAGDDAAGGGERIVAQLPLEPATIFAERRTIAHRRPRSGAREPPRHRDVPRQPAAGTVIDREVAGGEERLVRRHRLVGPPVHRGPVARTFRPTRWPFATTCLPCGTVMWRSTRALSRGWSLAGNHHAAMCGSFIVTTSWRLASQFRSPSQAMRPGFPAYFTRTLNTSPVATGSAGVIRSSCSFGPGVRRLGAVDAHPTGRQQQVEVERGEVLGRAHGQPVQPRRRPSRKRYSSWISYSTTSIPPLPSSGK